MDTWSWFWRLFWKMKSLTLGQTWRTMHSSSRILCQCTLFVYDQVVCKVGNLQLHLLGTFHKCSSSIWPHIWNHLDTFVSVRQSQSQAALQGDSLPGIFPKLSSAFFSSFYLSFPLSFSPTPHFHPPPHHSHSPFPIHLSFPPFLSPHNILFYCLFLFILCFIILCPLSSSPTITSFFFLPPFHSPLLKGLILSSISLIL